MKKLTLCICLFLVVISTSRGQESKGILLLRRYIARNYSLPESLKSDCNFNYLAMSLETNSKGEITEIQYLNESHPDLKKNFDYLKGYKIDNSAKVRRRPILLIATIDQKNRESCGILYPYDESPSKVSREMVDIVRAQLSRDLKTIILGVFSVEVSGPPVY